MPLILRHTSSRINITEVDVIVTVCMCRQCTRSSSHLEDNLKDKSGARFLRNSPLLIILMAQGLYSVKKIWHWHVVQKGQI